MGVSEEPVHVVGSSEEPVHVVGSSEQPVHVAPQPRRSTRRQQSNPTEQHKDDPPQKNQPRRSPRIQKSNSKEQEDPLQPRRSPRLHKCSFSDSYANAATQAKKRLFSQVDVQKPPTVERKGKTLGLSRKLKVSKRPSSSQPNDIGTQQSQTSKVDKGKRLQVDQSQDLPINPTPIADSDREFPATKSAYCYSSKENDVFRSQGGPPNCRP
ncbi:hypothetical protein STAS_17865, partial [Striga asiatica]